MSNQSQLLEIVKKWKIKPGAQYREFKCGNCLRNIHKAWHHQLNSGDFNTPVHLCNDCQKKTGILGGKYKQFECDKCSKNIFKSYHVWKKTEQVFEESHFCKKCFLNSTKIH